MELGAVLDRLDPLQQAAVDLVYFRGLSAGEAAQVLAVEPGALLGALSATRKPITAWALADDRAELQPSV